MAANGGVSPEGPPGRVSEPPFDPLQALRVLDRHGLRFVLVGGFAAAIRGSPVITGDLDLCYARDPKNLERLAAALQELGATLRGAPPDVPFQLDAKTLERGDAFTFNTTAGPVDCVGTPAGTSGFEELDAHATAEDLDGLTVRVASLEDLMRMKRAAGRPKDLIGLEWLGAVRDEREEE
jgi:Nucleotidyl transferase AbiEii toxin, Type IV TA system